MNIKKGLPNRRLVPLYQIKKVTDIVEDGGYFFVSIKAIINGITMPNIINTIVSNSKSLISVSSFAADFP